MTDDAMQIQTAIDILGREEVIGALRNTLASPDAPLKALLTLRIWAAGVPELIAALRPFASEIAADPRRLDAAKLLRSLGVEL